MITVIFFFLSSFLLQNVTSFVSNQHTITFQKPKQSFFPSTCLLNAKSSSTDTEMLPQIGSTTNDHFHKLTRSAFLTSCISMIASLPTTAAITTSEILQNEDNLWEKINSKRPGSYSSNEIQEIESLINSIISSAQGMKWDRNLLVGTWRVAYIRPGENGGGLDRRIPFPELPFNESYQKFTKDSVTNIGELVGPSVRVEVKGGLKEDDVTVDSTPKRFRANITGGDLCAGNFCAKLPIEGEGLFDGVYLGQRIRIGQNLNGSGALVVQVRV